MKDIYSIPNKKDNTNHHHMITQHIRKCEYIYRFNEKGIDGIIIYQKRLIISSTSLMM